MKTWTEQEINDIVKLKDRWGRPINIFRLHGVLFVGNTENGMWDLSKNYTRFSEHSIGFSLDDFDYCETDEDVLEVFGEGLERNVTEKLV